MTLDKGPRLPLRITVSEMLQEVTREIEARRRLYPVMIHQKKLSVVNADHRLACMVAVKEHLETIVVEPRL